METFTSPKELVENDVFETERAKALARMDLSTIDYQIRGIIEAFKNMPYCFTLQSCYGHIIKQNPGSGHEKRIDPDPTSPAAGLYQIAYLALVLENCPAGHSLYLHLAEIPRLDPEFIQFGSAEWFWETQGFRNSYVIQVCPYRFRHFDRFAMFVEEARTWLSARELFFVELKKLCGA